MSRPARTAPPPAVALAPVRERRCRPCGKVRYATEARAEAVIRYLATLGVGTHRPIRAYRAACGWVHLTSQPAPRWTTTMKGPR
ncbi:hypothetical protein amrb99_98020 [Actinomadura sp. RB99]|uniref:hypothetical protein n=1 Tax=Actinomadura sp. RB99 TaxID=2691577 RepID=UPI001683E0B3|nr:hypothetical protein [Actinomadura sp. RB99]MBD2900793.1 hypothetical protein [Actinomadura sp. RB99]